MHQLKVGEHHALMSLNGRSMVESGKELVSYKHFRIKAAKLAIQTFTKTKTVKSIHIQMDNVVAICYLLKTGDTKNQQLTAIFQEIWDYLLLQGITITVEYLPGKLNIEVDRESRQVKDSNEWRVCQKTFNLITKKGGTPRIDLFASRISHQLPQGFHTNFQCTSMEAGSLQSGKGCFSKLNKTS